MGLGAWVLGFGVWGLGFGIKIEVQGFAAVRSLRVEFKVGCVGYTPTLNPHKPIWIQMPARLLLQITWRFRARICQL